MSRESKKPSLFRPRLLTLVVLIAAAAAIAVANLSRDEQAVNANQLMASPPPNLSYGWPLIWYWCQFKPGTLPPINPVVVQWNGRRLAGNLAIWFVIFALLGTACQWLLHRFCAPFRFRPRVLTLIVLAAVAGPTVLANLTCENTAWNQGRDPALLWQNRPTYGWPLIWRWRCTLLTGYGQAELDQNFSAGRLIGNLVVWLAMFGAAAVACEWLLRRYRPRLRWSLRTMLAVVGLAAALCAWCAVLRDRADIQDPMISEASSPPRHFYLYLKHWGPQWFDFFGARRFRRRIVGATVSYSGGGDEPFLERLGRFPDFRYLGVDAMGPPPQMKAGLGNLSPECLAVVGKLAQLEELHLSGMIDSGDLARLSGLARLKTLGLQFHWDVGEEGTDENDEPNGATPLLADLPPLPRLEAIDLGSPPRTFVSERSTVGAQELRQLAVLPRLKSLNLGDVDVTDAGLAELASLQSLEELAIGDNAVSPAGLRSLLDLKRLKALHIQRYAAINDATKAELPYQNPLQVHGNWYKFPIGEEEMEDEDEGETSQDADDEMLDGDDALSDDETESVDEAEPNEGAMSPARWQVWRALESVKAWHREQNGSVDQSDRLTTVALDHGGAIFALESEVDEFRAALDALRRANPGIVIDSDFKWFVAGPGFPMSLFLASPCGGP